MGLVIKVKGQYAPVGSEKLYKDALVDDGTLLLHDFSNRGTLNNFSFVNGSPVNDLSDDISAELGINNSTILTVASSAEPELSGLGLGVDVESISLDAYTANTRGIIMGDSLPDYIQSEQPNLLWLFWVRHKPTILFNAVFMGTSGELIRGEFMHARTNMSGEISVMMADGTSGSAPAGGGLLQMAVEYQGSGQPLRRYVNGVFSGEGTTLPGAFGAAELPLYIGSADIRQASLYYYRGFITDLDRSPLTAQELVEKDWNYCHGIGEYAGTGARRPFIDNV